MSKIEGTAVDRLPCEHGIQQAQCPHCENDALLAHIEELRKFCSRPAVRHLASDNELDVLDRTPSQSLARIKAQALREAAEEMDGYVADWAGTAAYRLRNRADRIEKETT